jgi:hypothetical protein
VFGRLRGAYMPDAELIAVLLLPGMQEIRGNAEALCNVVDGAFASRQHQTNCLTLELFRVLLSTLLGCHAGGLSGSVLPFLSVHQTGVISVFLGS